MEKDHGNGCDSADPSLQCVRNRLCEHPDKKQKSKDNMPDHMPPGCICISCIHIDHHIFCLGGQCELRIIHGS